VFLGLFVALLFALSGPTAMAQSTIFNIPSTDTVDKGKAYFEFDFLPQAPGVDATLFFTEISIHQTPGILAGSEPFCTLH